MAWVRVGVVADFPDERGVRVQVAGRRLAIFRTGARVFAVDDTCSHRGFPLHDGTLNGLSVRCRTHGSCFDLESGAPERGPARRRVRTYPIAVVGDRVEVEIPD